MGLAFASLVRRSLAKTESPSERCFLLKALALSLTFVAFAPFSVVGCGGGASPSSHDAAGVKASVEQLYTDWGAGRVGDACDRITPEVQKQMVKGSWADDCRSLLMIGSGFVGKKQMEKEIAKAKAAAAKA